MNNREFAIESFINFCDDMMIAEESLKTMKKRFKEFNKSIAELSKSFNNTDNIDEKISILKSVISVSKEYDKEMQKDTFSEKENILQYIKIFAGALITILGGGVLHKGTSMIELIIAVTGGSIAGSGIGNLMANKMDLNTYKNSIPKFIHIYEQYLKMLQKFKSEKFTSFADAEKAYSIKLKKDTLIYERKNVHINNNTL